jgi:hypothetical protein
MAKQLIPCIEYTRENGVLVRYDDWRRRNPITDEQRAANRAGLLAKYGGKP